MARVRILYRGGMAETEEKKSRFICTVRPVRSAEEANSFIAEMKKKYWNATHNCSVYVVGDDPALERCSDDGEPQGTAGRPMLDVMRGEKIHNVCAVVTRYFGGTLLGTGGLVRAYSGAVREGLKNCVVLERIDGVRFTAVTDYRSLGKIQYICAERDAKMTESRYGADAETDILVPEEEEEAVKAALTEGTNGTVRFKNETKVRYAWHEGAPVYL